MNFDPGYLLVSFLVSGAGFVSYRYGRSQQRTPQIIVGLALMVFPYFVGNLLAMIGIAAVLLVGLKLAIRFGW